MLTRNQKLVNEATELATPPKTSRTVDRLALQEQLQIHVSHTTSKLLTPLYQMEGLLKDANPHRTTDIVKLCALLGRLHLTLTQKLEAAAAEPDSDMMQHTIRTASRPVTPENMDPSNVHGSQPRNPAMYHRSILPPSPEVRQVRKTSYGVI